MTTTAWQRLIKSYADGRDICNCGEAYYTRCGRGIDKDGNNRTDMLACQYGCQTNKIFARDEIAVRIMQDRDHPINKDSAQ